MADVSAFDEEGDLHEGPVGPDPIPADALLDEWPGCCSSCNGTGSGGPGAGPETNGRCWDCRGTGHQHDGECGPEVDVCPEGCGLVNVEEMSIETSGQLETERDWKVIRLACGHEIVQGPVARTW